MGDMGEVFKVMNEAKKERRASNAEKSTDILIEHGVIFTTTNGSHLTVDAGAKGKIDFYPSTGLWIVRANKKRRRGVFNLIKYIGN